MLAGAVIALLITTISITHALTNKNHTPFYRGLWIALIVLMPFWGSVVYWFYGRKEKEVDLSKHQSK